MATSNDLIEAQAQKIVASLAELISPQQSYALVDFPDHCNVGDSAIWLGELALFDRMNLSRPVYVCTVESYSKDELMRCCPEGAILIHGGGNFGDIYPKHQRFRIRLMQDFPDREIIQLPQSISFSQAEAVADTAAAIARHGRFRMLVRDHKSLEFARQHLQCPSQLLPDMAFGMGPLARPALAARAVFMLLREDAERADYDRTPLLLHPNTLAADWIAEDPGFHALCWRRTGWSRWWRGGISSAAGQLELYNRLAQGRLLRGIKLLASGRYVVTDRLHAHILSTMMDIPHVVLDNSYGKIFGYMDAWTSDYQGVRKARTAEQALIHLRDWGV